MQTAAFLASDAGPLAWAMRCLRPIDLADTHCQKENCLAASELSTSLILPWQVQIPSNNLPYFGHFEFFGVVPKKLALAWLSLNALLRRLPAFTAGRSFGRHEALTVYESMA